MFYIDLFSIFENERIIEGLYFVNCIFLEWLYFDILSCVEMGIRLLVVFVVLFLIMLLDIRFEDFDCCFWDKMVFSKFFSCVFLKILVLKGILFFFINVFVVIWGLKIVDFLVCDKVFFFDVCEIMVLNKFNDINDGLWLDICIVVKVFLGVLVDSLIDSVFCGSGIVDEMFDVKVWIIFFKCCIILVCNIDVFFVELCCVR